MVLVKTLTGKRFGLPNIIWFAIVYTLKQSSSLSVLTLFEDILNSANTRTLIAILATNKPHNMFEGLELRDGIMDTGCAQYQSRARRDGC